MEKYKEIIYEEIKNMRFKKVSPQKYAEELKERFFNNPKLWYERISPKSKADELIKATNGDYSEIWDDYCPICFKSIDKHTTQDFYLSEEGLTCMCENCFNEMQKIIGR